MIIKKAEKILGWTTVHGPSYPNININLCIQQFIFSNEFRIGTKIPCKIWLLYYHTEKSRTFMTREEVESDKKFPKINSKTGLGLFIFVGYKKNPSFILLCTLQKCRINYFYLSKTTNNLSELTMSAQYIYYICIYFP